MKLLPLEEREKRLRIVERDVKGEFWKILRESIEYRNFAEMQEVIELHDQNKKEEAHNLALKIKARQEIASEPNTIIRETKPIFDMWNGKEWVRKAKELLKVNQKHGGNNA